MKNIFLFVILPIIATLLILCLLPFIYFAQFEYVTTWRYNVDFAPYEDSFVLVKDYVQDYMDGREGSLTISHSQDHKYELYDSEKRSYLECPEDVKNALKTISQEATSYKNSNFDWICCTEDEISFEIETVPYKLSYSPTRKPTMITHSDSDVVLTKWIKDGWYHVTVRSP